MDILEGNIIKLRALEPSDIDLIYSWENNTSNWLVSNTLTPFSKYILKKYISNSYKDIFEAKQLRLMIDLKTESYKTVGTIDLFDYDPFHQRAGVGILIAENNDRHKGFADEALKILINYAFNTLNIHQLYCNITKNNAISIKLFTNSGFNIVGEKKDWIRTNDGWIGEYFLQLIKNK